VSARNRLNHDDDRPAEIDALSGHERLQRGCHVVAGADDERRFH
jgi:hypothetical protein